LAFQEKFLIGVGAIPVIGYSQKLQIRGFLVKLVPVFRFLQLVYFNGEWRYEFAYTRYGK